VRIASIVLSDTDKWYNDAGQQLKKSLGKFDQSLQGGEFVIVSGMRILSCLYLRTDTNKTLHKFIDGSSFP